VKGRRRALRLDRTGFGTAWWLLTSRAAITVAVVAVLVALTAVLAWTKPWQELVEERVVYVPVPVVVTVEPSTDSPAVGGDGERAPRFTPAPDQASEQS